MEDIMRKFENVSTDPYKSVAEAKERLRKKVIGCFPMHIPEEIIHAAGLLPVVMWESNEVITEGLSHILPFNCAIVRSVVDDAVKRKLAFLDGLIFYDTCMQVRGLPYTFERNMNLPYLEVIHLPPMLTNPVSKDFLVENLMVLKTSLEKLIGQEIKPEALKQSITTYNKNRKLLRRLYDLRRKKPGILRASEIASIVSSSMKMLKEEHNRLLEELLPLLEQKQVAKDSMTKIVLSGSNCMAPRKDVLDMVEDQRMVVVDDDFFVGPRYFANDAPEDLPPLEALAERYLKRTPPCPTKTDWETDWTDYIIDMVRRNKAQGVLTFRVKYCPPHAVYYPHIKRKLNEARVPELMFELEHEVYSFEPMKTRLQAFAETIGGKN